MYILHYSNENDIVCVPVMRFEVQNLLDREMSHDFKHNHILNITTKMHITQILGE